MHRLADNPVPRAESRIGKPPVHINYYVDAVFLEQLAGPATARVTIRDDGNGEIVADFVEAGLVPASSGSALIASWSGHQRIDGTRAGIYSVEIQLESADRTPLFAAVAPHSILIANDALDCADLWAGGVPDRDEDESLYCRQYQEPSSHPADYAIYFPIGWDEEYPLAAPTLRLIAQALRDSWDRLELSTIPFGGMKRIAVVISQRPASTLGARAEAFAYKATASEALPDRHLRKGRRRHTSPSGADDRA